MGFWTGVMRGVQDAEARKERDREREDRLRMEEKADTRYESELAYRTSRDELGDSERAGDRRRQKDKDMAAAGFVYDEESDGYVHQSQLAARTYAGGAGGTSLAGGKMSPSEARAAAAAKLNLNREVGQYYTKPEEGVTMAPGARVMTEADKKFFETLESDPRTQASVNEWYVANKDKYGLTVDMLPTLYTLDVSTPAGQEALTTIISVDDPTGFSKAVAAGQASVPAGTFATLNEGALPMSLADEDKQYQYSKERVASDLAREQIRRSDAGLSTTRITQILRDLDNAGTEGAAFQGAIEELGGPDYLVGLEDSGDKRWSNLTNNSWFSNILSGGQAEALKGIDRENVKAGDIVTGSDGNTYLASESAAGIQFAPTSSGNLLPPKPGQEPLGNEPSGNEPGAAAPAQLPDRRLSVGEAERVKAIETKVTADQEGSVVSTSSGAEYKVTVTDSGSVRLVPVKAPQVQTEVVEMESVLSPSDIGTEVKVSGRPYTVVKSPDTGLPILAPIEVPKTLEEGYSEYGEKLGREAIADEGRRLTNALLDPNLTPEEADKLTRTFADSYGEDTLESVLKDVREKGGYNERAIGTVGFRAPPGSTERPSDRIGTVGFQDQGLREDVREKTGSSERAIGTVGFQAPPPRSLVERPSDRIGTVGFQDLGLREDVRGTVLSGVTAPYVEAKGAPLTDDEELAIGVEAVVAALTTGDVDEGQLQTLIGELEDKYTPEQIQAAIDSA